MNVELKTRKQVAELLLVTSGTVRLWEKKGLLNPQCHVNGHPRYSTEAVNKLINKKNTTNG
jgi:DNA-binding transcriptional MerR regulator